MKQAKLCVLALLFSAICFTSCDGLYVEQFNGGTYRAGSANDKIAFSSNGSVSYKMYLQDSTTGAYDDIIVATGTWSYHQVDVISVNLTYIVDLSDYTSPYPSYSNSSSSLSSSTELPANFYTGDDWETLHDDTLKMTWYKLQ